VDTDETTIPRSLRRAAVVMSLAQLKSVLEENLTDDERDELRSIERKLAAVASGKLKVEQPDTPVTAPVESGSEIETIQEGDMGNSREDLKGL
jgi:hypothetical protein